ncbi:MAG: hypothetical protein NDI75_15025 [Candidatus Didemnitutus sp.]|nr:hypothetical protein [Candidatus Didemnitutus sp.]
MNSPGASVITPGIFRANRNGLVPRPSSADVTAKRLLRADGSWSSTFEFADGSAAAPSITFASDPDTGFYRPSADVLGVALAGVRRFNFGTNGANSPRLFGNDTNSGFVEWDSAGMMTFQAAGTNQNVVLAPSGSGFVYTAKGAKFETYGISLGGNPPLPYTSAALRTGNDWRLLDDGPLRVLIGTTHVAGYTMSGNYLLGTTTDSANGRLQIASDGTAATGIGLGTDSGMFRSVAGVINLFGPSAVTLQSAAGTFTINTVGANVLRFQQNGSNSLAFDSSQNATFAGTAINATSAYVNIGAAKQFAWNARSQMFSPSDGVILLQNNAATGFSFLLFGGETSAFPALKRSSTSLQVRLADDSGDGGLTAGTIVANTCLNVGGAAATVGAGAVSYGGTTATTVGAAGAASALPANPLGYIIVNVAGTTAKIPYYNS